MIKVFLLFLLLLTSYCSESAEIGAGYQYIHGRGYVNDGVGRTHHANYLESIPTVTIDYNEFLINLSSRSGVFYKKRSILFGIHKVKQDFVTPNIRIGVDEYSPALGLYIEAKNIVIQLRQSLPVETEYNNAFLKLGERHFLITYRVK